VLSVAIGRAGIDTHIDYVHVVYPTVTTTEAGSRQDAVVVDVGIDRFGANKTVGATMIQQIIADHGASVWRPHLIDADRWGYHPGEYSNDANIALIDWYEVTTPKTGTSEMRYRGELLRGSLSFSTMFDLARSGGNAKAWTPAPLAVVNNFYGHYDHGSFFVEDNRLDFFVHWTESDAAVSGPNMYLYGNVVQVQP
jgi:hypothetical protein